MEAKIKLFTISKPTGTESAEKKIKKIIISKNKLNPFISFNNKFRHSRKKVRSEQGSCNWCTDEKCHLRSSKQQLCNTKNWSRTLVECFFFLKQIRSITCEKLSKRF